MSGQSKSERTLATLLSPCMTHLHLLQSLSFFAAEVSGQRGEAQDSSVTGPSEDMTPRWNGMYLCKIVCVCVCVILCAGVKRPCVGDSA